MSIDEQIERAVERTRSIWGVVTAIGFVWVAFTLTWWTLIGFVVLSVMSYFGSIWLTGVVLMFTLDMDQVEAERQKETVAVGETAEGFTKNSVEAVGLTLGTVSKTSEAFGRYMDQPMFEWVDIVADKAGRLDRYIFESVTPRDAGGNLLPPRKEGFACFNGVTYKMAAQPA